MLHSAWVVFALSSLLIFTVTLTLTYWKQKKTRINDERDNNIGGKKGRKRKEEIRIYMVQ
ncbi:hypothetical protein ASPTUDRAFT_44771 [Aspergillus tubingensis CBS 134.48]|uniref:Uncharacterized protein n=1 Tax=Aspergillus tubingensis (strain CBS 134.48) TaxID=767770 RepID=A0A1L9N2Q5_ASPTC|nr:hypothetical protein ASPTUDRAFT_44771 [Aspergillus tubingensis CBS 134.48]